MSDTITVSITQELIDEYGTWIEDGHRCPIYNALRLLGVDVWSVSYTGAYLMDDRFFPFPQEVEEWQEQLPGQLRPISFELPAEILSKPNE
jgi:hypothetical protein